LGFRNALFFRPTSGFLLNFREIYFQALQKPPDAFKACLYFVTASEGAFIAPPRLNNIPVSGEGIPGSSR